ncbi:1-acyl-sn-glycerol-3-phosphate acyltransferase alpha-like [Bacillus rossius redtenbacheri]|uniref:1-acyl-sn-glycerol-3-phosphate acyltransferase alpha-like n=1 Tax=Bacillus rossius redtenbacheri TaxID=93214 RepID=UPI002FDD1044
MADGACWWSVVLLTPAACLLIAALLVALVPARSALRYYLCFAVYIGASSAVALACMPALCLRPFRVHNSRLMAQILKHFTKLLGITWELRHGEILAEDRGAVIVANHQSILDVLGMFNIWDVMGKCAAVAKNEVFYVWPFGLAAWLNGTVFIDRNNVHKANEQITKAGFIIREEKVKLWIFPEGTRRTKDVPMLPFKRGAFRVAISCQVPIIPVVYSPYHFIDNRHKYFRRGKIVITVLPEIPTKGLTMADVDTLMEDIRNKMVKTFEDICRELTT